MHRLFVRRAKGALFVAVVVGAGSPAAPAAAQSGDGRKGAATKADSGATAGSKAPGGRGGGRSGAQGRTSSVVLGATDVYRVKRGTLEVGIPIAGDLRPIETGTVRSRIDGVLQSVAVREGQAVKAGALLAKFESIEQESSLRSAEADQAAAKSDYETSRWNADQSKELFKVGAISERDLRTAEQAAEAAQARLAATDARMKVAANVMRDTRVVAPFSGTVEKRKVQSGENTSRGAEMFTVVRSDVLELTATVPGRRASEVKAGQVVRFMADGRQFEGRVARLSPTIDPASRSLTVYVQLPNPKGDLRGNTVATGQIIARKLDGVVVIPQTAVRNSADGGKPFVWRIQAGELASATVDLGITDDSRGMVEVRDGLKESDDIVIGTPGTLGSGMKVQVIGNEGRGTGRGSEGRGGRGRGAGTAAGGAGDGRGGKKASAP